MSQTLIDAARQALPGLEWTEIGPEVRTYIGQQLVYLTDRGSDGVFVYAGPDSHRWMPTIDEAAQWLRAQVEGRRNALDAALGEPQHLGTSARDWCGMWDMARRRADAAATKLQALAGLVAKWDDGTHGCEVDEWGRLLPCPQCDEEDYARAEARRLLGVS